MKNKLTIALLAIIVLIVGFVAYLFSSNTFISPIKFEKEISKVEQTTNSDQTSDIEKDLEETNLDNLDTELSAIEVELN